MLEKAFKGDQRYWRWVLSLLAVMGVGFACWGLQLDRGLTITGLSRDVSWGLYIAQFTFLVGVAASAVMVVLPYYLHNVKAFGKITIIGEFLAVAAVTMCMLFIVVDLGKPMRMLNVLLYPTPTSILFWDMVVLNGYLFLNIIIGWNVLEADPAFHPLGSQYSHGDGVSVCRFARSPFLAHRHFGCSLSRVGVLLRSRVAHHDLLPAEETHSF
jgi:Ni/Fe-hydrogenase subunit HybB-like protein